MYCEHGSRLVFGTSYLPACLCLPRDIVYAGGICIGTRPFNIMRREQQTNLRYRILLLCRVLCKISYYYAHTYLHAAYASHT